MSNFQVRIVSWSEAAAALAAVRRAVFIEEQQVPEELEWDGEDDHAVHALASDEHGTPIGCGRLLLHAPWGHIGRMAVMPDWRKQGVGSAILRALLAEATRNHLTELVLNAQTYAVPFYERFGFVRAGEEFLDAGIPHYRMQR